MTPRELLAKCDELLAVGGPQAELRLVLAGIHSGQQMRLCPGGPVGTVFAGWNPERVVVFFSAQEVKDFVQASIPNQLS